MKRMLLMLLIPLLCPLFFTRAYADGLIETTADTVNARAMENTLESDEREISGKLTFDGSYDYNGAISRLLHSLYEAAMREYRKSLKDAAAIVALAFSCSLLSAFCSEKKYAGLISNAACCAAAIIMVSGADSIIAQACEAVLRLSDYSKAAMPVVFTAAAASGAVAASAAKYAAVCIAVDVLISASQKLIVPCVYAYLALSVSRSLFDNSIIRSCAGFVKWTATTVMTVLTLAFSTYIGLTGLIAGSTDAAAVKAARTAISSALPVVGGIISDCSATVLSAAAVIRSSVGVFGLISVCALCVGPFAALGVKLLMYKAAAALSGMTACERLTALINDVVRALGLLLGMVGCCGIMLFISFMSAMKVAV